MIAKKGDINYIVWIIIIIIFGILVIMGLFVFGGEGMVGKVKEAILGLKDFLPKFSFGLEEQKAEVSISARCSSGIDTSAFCSSNPKLNLGRKSFRPKIASFTLPTMPSPPKTKRPIITRIPKIMATKYLTSSVTSTILKEVEELV